MKTKEKKNINKLYDAIPIIILGIIFIFFTQVTHKLTTDGNLIWSVGYVLKTGVISLFGGVALGDVLYELQDFLKEKISFKEGTTKNAIKMFFISAVVLTIVFTVYFLAFYPGILAYDSYAQIGQIMENGYSDHHPLINTLFIKLAFFISNSIKAEPNTGAAIYICAQGLLINLVFSYGIALCAKRMGNLYSIIILALLAIFPFNWFMAISMTKDVPFSAFFLLFVLAISEFFKLDIKDKSSYLTLCLIGLGALGCVLNRNNGVYALAFAVLVSVIWTVGYLIYKKVKKESGINLVKKYAYLIAVVMAAIIIGIATTKIAFVKLNAIQGDRREMLSVPIQQLSRTYMYHGGSGIYSEDDDSLDEESRQVISEFILNDGVLLYDPYISDPVKRNTNTWYVVNRTDKFASTYIRLFCKYPGDYINAFLSLNAGFIDFMDETHAHINEREGEYGLGYVQTKWEEISLTERGFCKDSHISLLWKLLDKWTNDNGYLAIPVLKYIFMPGIYLWIYIFMTVLGIKYKRKTAVMALAFVAGYYLTMFFGPCVQLRYVFPVMITVPFMALYWDKKPLL